MSGREFYNYAQFSAAAAGWRARGYEVVTPFDANSLAWQRLYGRDFDPHQDKCDWGDPALPEMLAEDFGALCRADAVAVLPDWRVSKGARAELLVATNLDKPIYHAFTHERILLVPHLIFEDWGTL